MKQTLMNLVRYLLVFFLFSNGVYAIETGDFLSPEEAFQGRLQSQKPNEIVFEFQAAPNYYLYQKQFQFTTSPATVVVQKVEFSPAEEYFDPVFQERLLIHRQPVTIRLTYERPEELSNFQLTVRYQGCSDDGLCYAPQEKTWDIDATKVLEKETDAVALNFNSDFQVSHLLQSQSFWVSIGLFYLFGLFLSFTPCVLPMIPILSALIIGEHRGESSKGNRGLQLSITYVFGMSVVYTLAGILAGLSGIGFAGFFQNIWFLIPFALLLFLLALGMFDVIQIQLPNRVQNSLTKLVNRIPGGYYYGSFLTGAISALIVGPCVAAPLAGALLYLSTTQDVWLGGGALFAMAWGMGTPLIIAGASARKLLPKVGSWMVTVKGIFGVLLLMVAWWMLTPLLPVPLFLLGCSALVVFLALHFGLFTSLGMNSSLLAKFSRMVAILLCFFAFALFLGAISGAKNPYDPLERFVKSNAVQTGGAISFTKVKSLAEIQEQISRSSQPVLLDFYADWCVACKEMEAFTFPDPAVQAALAKFNRLQLDITEFNAEDQAVLKAFEVAGAPSMLFFASNNLTELRAFRLVGFLAAEPFTSLLQEVLEASAQPL